jgi:hypothetical protein
VHESSIFSTSLSFFLFLLVSSGSEQGGVASNAKLAFMDISNGGGLTPPASAKDLYSPGYNAGARVHSNSWGDYNVGSGFYTAGNADTDRYLYEHKELIIIFAVGKNKLHWLLSIKNIQISELLHCHWFIAYTEPLLIIKCNLLGNNGRFGGSSYTQQRLDWIGPLSPSYAICLFVLK